MHAIVAQYSPAPGGADAFSPTSGRTRWEVRADLPDRDDFHIQVARTQYEHRAAAALVRRMYTWRGYACESLQILGDGDCRVTLVAWQDGDAVATLTLGCDSPAGLLCETLYDDEVASLRRPGKTLCEVTRLAVDPDFSSRHLLTSLFRTAHHHARTSFGATDAVIEVNPRHASYYQREFRFARLGQIRQCPRVGAPAVLLHRPLNGLAIPLTNPASPICIPDSRFTSSAGGG